MWPKSNNNNKHWLDTDCKPGTILSTLHGQTPSSLHLPRKWALFADEEIEAQKLSNLLKVSQLESGRTKTPPWHPGSRVLKKFSKKFNTIKSSPVWSLSSAKPRLSKQVLNAPGASRSERQCDQCWWPLMHSLQGVLQDQQACDTLSWETETSGELPKLIQPLGLGWSQADNPCPWIW